jgi:hypothetical protein
LFLKIKSVKDVQKKIPSFFKLKKNNDFKTEDLIFFKPTFKDKTGHNFISLVRSKTNDKKYYIMALYSDFHYFKEIIDKLKENQLVTLHDFFESKLYKDFLIHNKRSIERLIYEYRCFYKDSFVMHNIVTDNYAKSVQGEVFLSKPKKVSLNKKNFVVINGEKRTLKGGDGNVAINYNCLFEDKDEKQSFIPKFYSNKIYIKENKISNYLYKHESIYKTFTSYPPYIYDTSKFDVKENSLFHIHKLNKKTKKLNKIKTLPVSSDSTTVEKSEYEEYEIMFDSFLPMKK